MPRHVFLLLALAAAPAPAAQRGWEWRETTTPHFHVRHQAPWLPPGLALGLERIHSRLRMDLGMFSPWMAKERIELFVYKDQQSYVAGEFSPPAWSNGVAIYSRKAVAVPAQKDTAPLLRILAHETTHLLFVSYFREGKREAPHWLNEGLAMVEEAESPGRPETSLWYQQMAEMPAARWFPMERFLSVSPIKDLEGDKARVSDWYVQAYAVVHFILRKHSRLQFKGFCGHLRDGRSVKEALWLAYRYRALDDFEKRWRAWVLDPSHRRKVAALAESERSGEGDRSKSVLRKFSTGLEYRRVRHED